MLVWGWGRYFLWHIAGGDSHIGDYFQIGCENCNDYQNCSEFRRCRCACDHHPIFRHNTVITVITISPSPGIRTQISGYSGMHKMCSFWCKFFTFLESMPSLLIWFVQRCAEQQIIVNKQMTKYNKNVATWHNFQRCKNFFLRCKNVLKSNFDFPLCSLCLWPYWHRSSGVSGWSGV